MDLETPADGWWTYFGVALVSVAVAGVALGMPTTPPPDATGAINAVDRVAASTYNESASLEHDAEEVRISGTTLAMRNGGGTTRKNVAYGSLIWVRYEGVPDKEAFHAILAGAHPSEEYADPAAFTDDVNATRDALATNPPKWRYAQGRLEVRTLKWGGMHVTLIDA